MTCICYPGVCGMECEPACPVCWAPTDPIRADVQLARDWVWGIAKQSERDEWDNEPPSAWLALDALDRVLAFHTRPACGKEDA